MFDVEEGKKDISKQNKQHKKAKRISKDTKKILAICVSIFLIIFLIAYAYVSKQNDNYNDIKADKKHFIIYSKYTKTNTNYPIYVPYVNIKGDVFKKVNEDIDLFLGDFIRTKRCTVLYEYDISGVILSLVVKVVDSSTEYAPRAYFRSYNINLSTLEVISNEALLDFFQVDSMSIEALITNQFKYYYQDLVEKQYYQYDECTYECFLKHRGVENYMDEVAYYVRSGDLIAYQPFTFNSMFGEEDYFKDENYEFLLGQTEKNE